ncbi:type II toxin-antitoxin system RelE/ParE family toxin [Devosia sp.]|uniref:type II toxin-antitoxin system RelE/ParE family toxin n=1 Tax=Devosia sp. TaxID=1871048 RepID=UPI003A8EED2C
MRLRLSPQAERDIVGLHEFGSLTYGVQQADLYLDQLIMTLASVEAMPLMMRERDVVRPPVRIAVHRAHQIFYRIEGEYVWIIRILHHSANWRDLV